MKLMNQRFSHLHISVGRERYMNPIFLDCVYYATANSSFSSIYQLPFMVTLSDTKLPIAGRRNFEVLH